MEYAEDENYIYPHRYILEIFQVVTSVSNDE